MTNRPSDHDKVQMLQCFPVRLKSQEAYVEHEVMRASKVRGDKSADSDPEETWSLSEREIV